MSNQDVYSAPQNPWSYPRTLPQSWQRVAYSPEPEQQAEPPPPALPQQPQATLPDLASQAGGFAGGDQPAADRQQITPTPGQRPQPHQRYVASQTDRPPGEWGDPDWALKGAENYPGMPPGPYMPQGTDMWGLVHSISDTLGQGGSNYVGLPARQMGMYSQNMSKAFVEGQLAGYKLNFARMQQSLNMVAMRQQEELQKYREAFAIYGPHKEKQDDKEIDSPGDPDRLAQEIAALATQYDDPTLKHALEDGGVQAAERVLATRDGKSQDAQKILQMQKLQLEIEKLKVQTEAIRKGQGTTETIEQPMPEEGEEPDNTRAPGAAPPAGEEDRPPSELLEPDQPPGPDQPAQPPTPDQQPQPAAPTSDQQQQQGAVQPPAAPAQPTGAQTQVAGGGAPGTATDAPAPFAQRFGAEPAAPAAPTNTGPSRSAPIEPPAQRDAPETREQPKPTGAGFPKSIDEIVRPAQIVPKGFSRQRLDILARWYMEHGKNPFQAKDPDSAVRNEAVARRATQLTIAANRILDNKNLSPETKLALLDLVDPGFAAQARAIAAGTEPMPRATNSEYNRLLAQAVPRINKDYMQTDYDTKKKIRGDYTPGGYAGKQNLNVGRLAAAAQGVIEAMKGIDFSDSRVLNAINQYIATGTGDPAYTNFYTAWRAYSMEAVRLARGGQGAEADIAASIAAVPTVASQAQIAGALKYDTKAAVATITANRNYWRQQGMPGEMPGWDADAMSVLDKIQKGDIASVPIEGGAPAAPAAAAPVEKTIGGKTYYKQGDQWFER